MFFKLFLLFTIVPIIELAILIKAGTIFGVFNTIAIVIITAIAGAYLVKLEGLNVLYRIQENISNGIFPAEELLDGLLIFIAGALLLTPGFVTDILGFLMVFPPTRRILKEIIKKYIKTHYFPYEIL
ncbi:MAG: FxsA family protein [Candidatus Schekmanbacteria bacterium]|nr:MAG: FxsA family protein [Candidatus Schekmanbacteria bacterium]